MLYIRTIASEVRFRKLYDSTHPMTSGDRVKRSRSDLDVGAQDDGDNVQELAVGRLL